MVGAHHANVPFIIKRPAVKLIGRGMWGDQRHVNAALFKLADQATRFHGHHAHANARRLHFKGGDKGYDHRAQGVVGRGEGEGERCGDRVKSHGL